MKSAQLSLDNGDVMADLTQVGDSRETNFFKVHAPLREPLAWKMMGLPHIVIHL